VDFSIEGEFEDTEDVAKRIARALTDRFDAAGFVVFDYEFGPRPLIPAADNPKWGGYRIKFKIIERDKHHRFDGDPEAVRRNATVIGPSQQRTFTIDISKWEFCEGKTETQLEEFTIYVYTPPMLAIEKIRAICQQMPEYAIRVAKTARARDFYDVHVIVEESKIDLADQENLARMSHRGGRSCEKVARSGDGGRSRSGNHRTDLHRRSCSPSSHRGFRFLVRERHTTPPTCFAAQLVSLLASFSSAELRLATAGAPGGIAPGKDNRSTATPRFCVP
jgi:hypothetical protein